MIIRDTSNFSVYHVNCKICQKTVRLAVDPLDMKRYQEGEMIQKAFPYLSADEREMLLTGWCRYCFTDMCGPDDDVDDDDLDVGPSLEDVPF